MLLVIMALTVFAMAGCGDCRPAGREPPAEAHDGGWVPIPGGAFTVGSPEDERCRDDDEALHEVTVEGFALQRFEVTQRDFRAITGDNPSFNAGCDACPVDSVTVAEAEAFCAKLGARLPTEREWERAARGGTSTAFYAGAITSCMATDELLGELGWYKANSGGFSRPVGEKRPNRYGLFDMSGNVYEWTATELEGRRVVRGGSWYHNAHHARSANRLTLLGTQRLSYVGFRCATSEVP